MYKNTINVLDSKEVLYLNFFSFVIDFTVLYINVQLV